MWVTGRKYWWFVSYDGRMPTHLRLFKKIIERNDVYITAMEKDIVAFLEEVEAFIKKLPKAA